MGTENHMELLKQLQDHVPEMFKSDIPIFLPIELSKKVTLKLDNNYVFYEYLNDGTYTLVDKFAASLGGLFRAPVTTLELGTWDKNYGMQLQKSLNRWDRRTDLKGMPFINVNELEDNESDILQDILFHVTNKLHLSVKTQHATKGDLLEQGGINCLTLLQQSRTDTCSQGHNSFDTDEQLRVIPIQTHTYTLLAKVPTGNYISPFFVIDVFGHWSWFSFFSALIIISLLMHLCHRLLNSKEQRPPLINAFVMSYMFLLQQGSYPEDRHISKRILSLTLSMLTSMVFLYYTNDVTSQMTGVAREHPVDSFEDVVFGSYEVIIVGGRPGSTGYTATKILKMSDPFSAMYSVYNENFAKYMDVMEMYSIFMGGGYGRGTRIVKDMKDYSYYLRLKEKGDLFTYARDLGDEMSRKIASEVFLPLLPRWYNDSQGNMNWTREEIIRNRTTIWFCHRRCALKDIGQGKITDLDLKDEMTTIHTGISFRSDSEYVPLFNHHVLRALESGIHNRYEQWWDEVSSGGLPQIEIGLPKHEPMSIENVASLMYFLFGITMVSFCIAIVENLVKLFKSRNSRENEVTFISPLYFH